MSYMAFASATTDAVPTASPQATSVSPTRSLGECDTCCFIDCLLNSACGVVPRQSFANAFFTVWVTDALASCAADAVLVAASVIEPWTDSISFLAKLRFRECADRHVRNM